MGTVIVNNAATLSGPMIPAVRSPTPLVVRQTSVGSAPRWVSPSSPTILRRSGAVSTPGSAEQRLKRAEQELMEKNRRIEALEAQMRATCEANTGCSTVIPEYATDDEMEALCRKSEMLVQQLAALDGHPEHE